MDFIATLFQLVPLAFIVLVPPIAWLVAEFRGPRWLRIATGFATIMVFGLASLAHAYTSDFSANAYYNMTTHLWVQRTIEALEAGSHEPLLEAFRQFDADFHPYYEHRANYAELVDDFIAHLDAAEK